MHGESPIANWACQDFLLVERGSRVGNFHGENTRDPLNVSFWENRPQVCNTLQPEFSAVLEAKFESGCKGF